MEKAILLIAPRFMDIYKDIQGALTKLGYGVDFLAERSYPEDPDNVRGYKGFKKLLYVRSKKFKQYNEKRWIDLLNSGKYNKKYDVLFVIDGQSIDHILFSIIKERNPNIKCVNYLFDTCKGVYRFNKNFRYFDAVYTFDRFESKLFNINFLPIYWIANNKKYDLIYDCFALGRYSDVRLKLFLKINEISKKYHLNSYVQLVTDREPHMNVVKLKWFLRKIMNTTENHIPPGFYQSPLNSYESITPKDFRLMINQSRCIIDTNATHQDGLTARFTWALGAGKKIITTNQAVKSYAFYNPKQIYIVENINCLDEKELISFIKDESVTYNSDDIQYFELSNWIKTLING